MNIITAKTDNRIIGIGADLDYLVNGYPRLINENVAFPTEMVDIYEISVIPEDVKEDKYCYTEADGFFLNPNWEEPNKYNLPNETVQTIKDDTVAELIELGVL